MCGVKKTDAAESLCLACGLCCNGVLFKDVELRRGDDAKKLERLGISIQPKGTKQCFPQPCACFDGKSCTIYRDRPNRCRKFECHLFIRVRRTEMRPEIALRMVRRAQREAENVRVMLVELGQTDESLSMTERYADLMAQPIDLSAGEERTERRAELMMAVQQLMHLLQTEFLAESK